MRYRAYWSVGQISNSAFTYLSHEVNECYLILFIQPWSMRMLGGLSYLAAKQALHYYGLSALIRANASRFDA